MKTIQIKANDFFEFLKINDASMWSIFEQMIDGESKELLFMSDKEEIIFRYTLPQTLEELEKDKAIFVKELQAKIQSKN